MNSKTENIILKFIFFFHNLKENWIILVVHTQADIKTLLLYHSTIRTHILNFISS